MRPWRATRSVWSDSSSTASTAWSARWAREASASSTRATHLGLNEPVAIKCLKLQAGLDAESNETFARRFRDEGRLLYRLGQGNLDIVRCMTSATTTSP